MDTSRIPVVSAPTPAAQDQAHARDPHAFLRPQMRVKGEQGRRLGTVDTVDRDAAGALTSITVRHGLLTRKYTQIPVDRIKQVNDDAVVVEFSAASLNRVPRIARA
jgi:sporulation protein YlmC with PRC-barrel domain